MTKLFSICIEYQRVFLFCDPHSRGLWLLAIFDNYISIYIYNKIEAALQRVGLVVSICIYITPPYLLSLQKYNVASIKIMSQNWKNKEFQMGRNFGRKSSEFHAASIILILQTTSNRTKPKNF